MHPRQAPARLGAAAFALLTFVACDSQDVESSPAPEISDPLQEGVQEPVPEPEAEKIDHRGFLTELDDAALARGEAIYSSHCVNCHGTHDEPGSLPTSLRFSRDAFKNGSDPYSMYRTLTEGYGAMVAQAWMVPSQKYDVIHYIREELIKPHNPRQYVEIDEEYLASLPEGDSRGAKAKETTPWQKMDYGPNQVLSLEVGRDASNFAYKGNLVRLDEGPGGIAQGSHWMVYDYDTLRVAAAWSGETPIDWRSIHFDGRHAIHPRVSGRIAIENPTGPGWARPGAESFEDTRLVGRDGRRYGPLPRDWAQYRGMYYHGHHTLIDYTVGSTSVLELPGLGRSVGEDPVFTRTFQIGARSEEMLLQVAQGEPGTPLSELTSGVLLGRMAPGQPETTRDAAKFDGRSWLQVKDTAGLNVGRGDFTVTARVRTSQNGTLVAQTTDGERWVPNGLTWFLRGGRLAVDIGWVGACRGRRVVTDGEWHDVAFSYRAEDGAVALFVDGERDNGEDRLVRKADLDEAVLRIGYTASNFPSDSAMNGEIEQVRFYNRALERADLAELNDVEPEALWDLGLATDDAVANATRATNKALRVAGEAPDAGARPIVAGLAGDAPGASWSSDDSGRLLLRIPPGEAVLRFTCWFTAVGPSSSTEPEALARSVSIDEPERDLSKMCQGGPRRWDQVLTTEALIEQTDGPFEVDVLTRPVDNPWSCRMRLTGFDFTDDGDAAIVSSWDGSIWKVRGLSSLPEDASGPRSVPITWQRIASGLFQPLGVKIVDGRVYVTCRDQLSVLHDLNGDDEIDWIECFNNDHQVTEHFHEFAMGLQTDADGNFYYAKSARHAKTALVPHHGTLLKVSADGQETTIVANGFRAANGVCINPDGSFIVTDQEGHWNPKNRINYVEPGGFYGNMYGYHDVTDSSDEAMEKPLAWITNSFDRSPGELLWVDSPKWGPLQGQLLNLSYGYGTVFVVPHEKVDGQVQGGLCAFPIERSPTGIMRGRFHPEDGQLYMAGMFAWAGSQQQPGGLYRLRYTGRPVHLPLELSATKTGMTIGFSGELDAESVLREGAFRVKAWDLRRTKNYGSKHYDERSWNVASARLDEDGRTVWLEIPDIAPTRGMEIRFDLRGADGGDVRGTVHNTIHRLR